MSVRRGDESQRVRRSVCGQNKMYPVLKECLNCQSGLEQWLGQFHFTTPPWLRIKFVPHEHVCTHSKQFSAHFKAAGGEKAGTSHHLKRNAPRNDVYLQEKHTHILHAPLYPPENVLFFWIISSTRCNKLLPGTFRCHNAPINHPNTPRCELISSLTPFHVRAWV